MRDARAGWMNGLICKEGRKMTGTEKEDEGGGGMERFTSVI